ncbi:RapZ C-terminal domain-containing protein [Phaeodactylibacter luteus]|uniref:Phosphotransferase n=1 Tax=Phaeodactylibacter luteus TaxID=1564516 RepID=A0A5C6RLG6_9BACT|nr:RNase adapter RapZ [Phaeodactylibacter luteus]TXB62470.1 phosphotransferase [Phaeodactylibacter luteus]
MKATAIEQALSALFENWSGKSPELVLPLAPSGSARIYYRLQAEGKSAIGTYNPNRAENEAFIAFSRHFHELGLPVPAIYEEDLGRQVYLQEDLGATTLYSYLLQRGEGPFPPHLLKIYKRVVEELARLQIQGGKNLDYSRCYPCPVFDKQSMLWDFNGFKYHFLRLAGAQFDEQRLEQEAHRLADFLLEAGTAHFMFRDFQSRNIMVRNGAPFFIDYQGGRQGALQYDLASLLYQAKADIPEDTRLELLSHYLDTAGQLLPIDRERFLRHYYGFVLMRSIQVLGTYGLRGLYERKEHFLKSIPFALRNVQQLLNGGQIAIELPELSQAIQQITDSGAFEPFDTTVGSNSLLTVRINSFSYKKGLPVDPSGNGGGFTFDCRFLHNPGRYEPYKKLTGRDEPVINFLKHHSTMEGFLNDAFRMVDEAVENYIERSFTSLMVNFGCTGGQHRSVYAADALAQHLADKYGVDIELHHIEQERKKWIND